jgi:hypothetical protein
MSGTESGITAADIARFAEIISFEAVNVGAGMVSDSAARRAAERIIAAAIPLVAKAECERIRQLALAEAARIGASDFSNADVIASGALDDFAALIGETP